MKEMTANELRGIVETMGEGDQGWIGATIDLMNGWLSRPGGGIAVYVNNDLGHPQCGEYRFYSFGSPYAQFATDTPPDRLPDIGALIGWRYGLDGTYRGGSL